MPVDSGKLMPCSGGDKTEVRLISENMDDASYAFKNTVVTVIEMFLHVSSRDL